MEFKVRIAALAVPVLASLAGGASGDALTKPRDRATFARAMAQVKEGMTRANVRQILGEPDEVRGESLLGPEDATWCYGVDGPGSFPTLGQVNFDDEGRVIWPSGVPGVSGRAAPRSPPDPALFREEELRALLRLIDQTPELRGISYDPLPVIRVVNALQPLGKDRALAAIGEYLRVAEEDVSEHSGIYVVLRTLFDVPADPGHMPPLLIGSPWPKEPKDPRWIPRFPVAIVKGVPLVLVDDFEISGDPMPVGTELPYFRRNARLRPGPLVPTDHPVEVVDEFCRSFMWLYDDKPRKPTDPTMKGSESRDSSSAFSEQGMQMIVNQVLRLVRTVYRIEDEGPAAGTISSCEGIAARWRRIAADLAKPSIHWDADRCRYSFADGSCLPERPRYRREVWRIRQGGLCAGLSMQRLNPNYVNFSFESFKVPDARDRPKGVRIVRLAAPDKPLTRFTFTVGSGGCCMSSTERLAAGEKIQAVLMLADREVSGPVFEP